MVFHTIMKRFFTNTLLKWKESPLRTPLIVRGARQVGKTFSIQAFGRDFFQKTICVNFESTPIFKDCFDILEPRSILNKIDLTTQQPIIPGTTLLFFDEIQQCPRALQSLRYFKEEMPELHVIAAGSLIEFAIKEEDFSFPVGRVQFATMHPLSFEEFLLARGDERLQEALASFNGNNPPPLVFHNLLLERLREYFFVGGMPVSSLALLKTGSLLEVQYAQKALWDSFEADFGKYAQKSQCRYLKTIFAHIPRLIGTHVKYSRIDPDLPNPAREMKLAMELLRRAGLLQPISATSAGGLPLLAGLKETIFKLLFLDIGLVSQVMGVEGGRMAPVMAGPDTSGLMAGPLAEQFVGQELVAASDPLLDTHLFFWTRDHGVSEVDYLFVNEGKVYPVEVKAGKAGKLKSLRLFMEEKKAPVGIKISQEPLSWDGSILAVPLYLTAHLPRLLKGL